MLAAFLFFLPHTAAAPTPPPEKAAPTDDCPDWKVECNCYLYVSTILDLPRMEDIQPNADRQVGAVAVFQYPLSKHIGMTVEVRNTEFVIDECNYSKGTCGRRTVAYDDTYFLGFWVKKDLP